MCPSLYTSFRSEDDRTLDGTELTAAVTRRTIQQVKCVQSCIDHVCIRILNYRPAKKETHPKTQAEFMYSPASEVIAPYHISSVEAGGSSLFGLRRHKEATCQLAALASGR